MNRDPLEREIDEILDRIGRTPDLAPQILYAVQARYHYLPREALIRIGAETEITPSQLAGVATFYPQFRFQPAGRHMIKVCTGTACHLKGADQIYDAFKDQLKIGANSDTDGARLFTVRKVACLGCCMLAPAVQIDELTYGFVNPGIVGRILQDFQQSQRDWGLDKQGPQSKPFLRGTPGEIRICLCSSCCASGASTVYQELIALIHSLALNVTVKQVGCTGQAYQAPLLAIILPGGARYHYGKVKIPHLREILLRHFRPHRLSQRLKAPVYHLLEKIATDDSWEPVTRYLIDPLSEGEARFSGCQRHLATADSGAVEPLNLEEYMRHQGFAGLKECLRENSPNSVLHLITASHLRGRGGAGFLTGLKWHKVAETDSPMKYIIANGDEGDPGAFMDRMLLESFPFRVIEGMLIAAYAVGASQGFLYIRAEYPYAYEQVMKALEICAENGLMGSNILGTGFSCNLEVVLGGGAFVCGEETALIAALEGKRGIPHPKPPYPSEIGFRQRPTLVNNIETLALIPWIVANGGSAFAAMGTEGSKGSKVFALAGKVVRSGLIEVELGVSLRKIVMEIGGGIPDGKQLKAVQIGGPSGGCLPAALMDVAVDYEALTALGSIMGSGGLIVLDEDDCMVDIARYFMSFTQRESCGQCTLCRLGTKRLLKILENLCAGKGAAADLDELLTLGEIIQRGSRCGLGRTAPNPVLSALTYFQDEFEAHLHGKCPAKKCRQLIAYKITEACIGCTRCAQRCPSGAIAFNPYHQHQILPEKCIKCGACKQACRSDAVVVE